MNLIEFAFYHRRTLLLLTVALAIAGVIAAFSLPVTLFPKVDFPRIAIYLNAGDRPAEEMSVAITNPVEQAVRQVQDVVSVRSTTSRGSAEISVFFKWGTDMVSALLQVNAALAQMAGNLPPGVQFQTQTMNPTIYPIIAYSLTSGHTSLAELYDIAQYQINPFLLTIDGVAEVQIIGGTQTEFHVKINPVKLQAYQLTPQDIQQAIASANIVAAVGKLEDRHKLYLNLIANPLRSLTDICTITIATSSQGMIQLHEVADIEASTVPEWIKVTADGKDAVLFQIIQQPDGNSVQIAQAVKDKLEEFKQQLSHDIAIANWYDQSHLVIESAKSVRDDILVGAVIAAIILWLFLRNIKVTLISLLVVPTVLAISVLFLLMMQMSFNTMTLGGMAAAIGLIIDDTIVMIEQIIRKMRQSQSASPGASSINVHMVLASAQEFSQPLIASTSSTIIIFLPLAFLSGVTGAFFKALSLTMAASLIVSFLLSLFVVPILAAYFLNEKDAAQEDEGEFGKKLSAFYASLLETMIKKVHYGLLGIGGLLLLGYIAYHHVGSGFMPAMDEGGFVLDYYSKPGTSLSETNHMLEQVETILRQTADVNTYSRRTGTQLGGGVTEANEGDFFVRLQPRAQRRPIEDVMTDIRTRIHLNVPGLDVELQQLMEDVIGDLTDVPQPIEVKLFARENSLLEPASLALKEKIAAIPGIVSVHTTIHPAGDAVEIYVHQDKATLAGIDPAAIADLMHSYLHGNIVTNIQQGMKMVGIRLKLEQDLGNSLIQLENMPIRSQNGTILPLKEIASFKIVSGQPQINMDNMRRTIAITGRIDHGDMGSAIKEVKKILAEPGVIPDGVYYELGGLYAQQQIAFHGLMIVFIAAIILVYLLLTWIYEDFLIASIIILMPLIATSAVFIGLWLTQVELNISSMMGMTMILGIVTEVAIFLFCEYQLVQSSISDPKAAIIAAAKNRMRPILMTSITAIFTLMPLALGIGEGSAMQKPLAIAIISGLIAQIPLVLLVMPSLYCFLVQDGQHRLYCKNSY